MRHVALLLVIILTGAVTAGCAENAAEIDARPAAPSATAAASPTTTPSPTSVQKAAPAAPVAKTPATAELLSASLSSEKIRLGESTTLSFSVKNTGDEDGSFAVQLLVDGQVQEEKTYRLIAKTSEKGSFTFTPTKKGDYTLSLATSLLGERGSTDAFSDTFRLKVILPADIKLVSAQVSEREVEVNSSIQINADLMNGGEESGTREIRLFVNGQVAQTQSATLEGGERKSLTFDYTSPARGTLSFAVEDQDLGSVFFFLPATYEVLTLFVDKENPEVADHVTATFEIRNVGDKGGTVSGSLMLGQDVMFPIHQYIGPQNSQRLVAPATNVTFTDARQLSLVIGDQVAKVLTIVPRAPQLSFTSVKTPSNSGWACYDEVQTSFVLANAGSGRDVSIYAEFWVDGVQKNVNGQKVLPIGTIAAGAQYRSPTLTLTPVEDECGNDDSYVLVIKLYGLGSPGVSSSPVSFTV